MKRTLLNLVALLGLCGYMQASVSWEWHGWSCRETYDFVANGLYYGIISESRGEVHVMNPNVILNDPYPYGETSTMPEYRGRAIYPGADVYFWEGGYYSGNIEIPATVEHEGKEYKVVRIAYGAFAWCDKLTSLRLPSTIREIRYGAFSMCSSLSEINLPAGVRVSGGAFYGCDALKSLDFSQSEFQYHYSADNVVCQCAGLEEIYLPPVWYEERKKCYLFETGDRMAHLRVSDYYTDYDDFPLEECGVDHGYAASHAAARPMELSGTKGQYPDDWPIWMYGAQVIELEGCAALRKIHCTAAVAPELYNQSMYFKKHWDEFYEDCILYVPEGSLESYQTTAPWSSFKNIVEEPVASVGTTVVAVAGCDMPRQIYDLAGNLRATVSGDAEPELAPGLYIERCGSTSRKIVVRR